MTRRAIRLTLLLLLPLASPVFGQVNLVVSVKPLQLIAESIVGDNGNIRVLVPVSGSPHHYTMTPSDRLALESADLIVYVGEQLETELHEVMDNLATRQRIIQLIALPDLVRRRFAGTESIDPHIWLDSRNGLLIAATLRDVLGEIDSGNQALWQENYRLLEQQIQAAEKRWRLTLEAVPDAPYAVYHDAIGYFESQFERRHSVALVEDPEIQPGIRQMMAVRRAIAEQQPVCLFTDVTSRQNTIDTLFADHSVLQVELDLLGDRLGQTEGYPQLLENLVTDFSSCLAGGPD